MESTASVYPPAAFFEVSESLMRRGISCRFQAKGSSMWPFIKDGDRLTVSPIRGSLPGIGEVVAFTRPGSRSLWLHRIIGRKDEGYLLCGDCAQEADGEIPRENILGRVTKVERNGRTVQLGFGRDRWIVVVLTRTKLLSSFLIPAWRVLHGHFF